MNVLLTYGDVKTKINKKTNMYGLSLKPIKIKDNTSQYIYLSPTQEKHIIQYKYWLEACTM